MSVDCTAIALKLVVRLGRLREALALPERGLLLRHCSPDSGDSVVHVHVHICRGEVGGMGCPGVPLLHPTPHIGRKATLESIPFDSPLNSLLNGAIGTAVEGNVRGRGAAHQSPSANVRLPPATRHPLK